MEVDFVKLTNHKEEIRRKASRNSKVVASNIPTLSLRCLLSAES